MLAATGALGGLFVAGQVATWRGLAAQGVFLASSPHSSFFYVLTGAHAFHLLGGLAWFAALWARLGRLALVPGGDAVSLFALYWHYLGVLWLYLALLLFAT
jgi:cytochrome c oxidase subunit 3